MLKVRIFSAVIGIPLLLSILYLGAYYWWGFFILLGIIALFEYYSMMSVKGYSPQYIPGYLLLLIIMLQAADTSYLLPALLLIMLLMAIFLILGYPGLNISDIALSFYGAFYLGFFISFAFRIYYLDDRFWIMVLAFLLTWASDTGGYFAGRFWGHKTLAPELSPKKTREGAVGAVLLSMMVSALFFSIIEITSTNFAYVLILGLSASIMAQIGDLMISAMKRYFGVKDSGKIIPGHGGVLDRFDSFLMVLPLVYYFFLYCV
jgi:phosphatidate cytidylyltransferase